MHTNKKLGHYNWEKPIGLHLVNEEKAKKLGYIAIFSNFETLIEAVQSERWRKFTIEKLLKIYTADQREQMLDTVIGERLRNRPNHKLFHEKAGIFMLTNNISKKHFIKKAESFERALEHFARKDLMEITSPYSSINRDLFNLGYNNFSFTILAYGKPERLNSMEKHFIQKIKPQYNPGSKYNMEDNL